MRAEPNVVHEMVADFKRVCAELGKVPTRDEYIARGKFRRVTWEAVFQTWPAFKAAAGSPEQGSAEAKALESPKKPKITNEDIFGRSIREVLQPFTHAPKRLITDPTETILAIPDTHFPFASADTLCAIYEWADRHQPDRIIQVGDLYDQFSHSKFPRSRNIYNPFEETRFGQEQAQAMWATLRRICPSAKLHQILGNHDVRPLKRIIECYPEGEPFFSIDKYFQFDGVTTIMDVRQPLEMGDCVAIHGYLNGLGKHRDYLRRNVICGHSHKGGVVFRAYGDAVLWELNCGLAGDPESKVLGYTPLKVADCTLGFGWRDQDGPRFISLG